MKLRGISGIEATITVNGEDTAREYGDPDTRDTPKRVTRYIEATDGAHFSIDIAYAANCKHRGLDIKQQVWIDGKLKHDELHRTEKLQRGMTRQVRRPNRGPKRVPKAPFRWKALRITDDAPEELNNEQRLALELVGLISVKLFRKERLESTGDVQTQVEVPESKLKGRGIYIGVDCGEAAPFEKHEWEDLDPPDQPWAEFNFQYRSHLALLELRIIPIDWGRKRIARRIQVDREQHERMLRGIKRERGPDGDPEADSDYCEVDEERSKIVLRRQAWIDISTDAALIVHDSNPGWLDAIPFPKKKRARVRGAKSGGSGVQMMPKAKRRSTQNHNYNDAGGGVVPTMSGGRDGRPSDSHTGEEGLFVDPEIAGDPFEANDFSDDDDDDDEEMAEEGDDDSTDVLNLSHTRRSDSNGDAYLPDSESVEED